MPTVKMVEYDDANDEVGTFLSDGSSLDSAVITGELDRLYAAGDVVYYSITSDTRSIANDTNLSAAQNSANSNWAGSIIPSSVTIGSTPQPEKVIELNGAVSPANRDLLNRMNENSDLRGHLQTATRMEVSPDAAEAESLASYFGAHGHNFSPGMLEGSQVSFKMAYDPESGDVVPSNINVSTGAGYHMIGQYFERPITPDSPYVLTNPSSGDTVTITSGRVYGQSGVYQQAEGFMSDGTPITLGSSDGQIMDRMTLGERFNGFGSPYVLSRLGQGIDRALGVFPRGVLH